MQNPANKPTILMVEDDENDVYLFEREFIRLMDRVRVRRVRDGVEATEYMAGVGEYADRQKYPLPGVILLDLKLPRINGLQFLKWLRSDFHGNNQPTPVIVLTSSDLEVDVQATGEAGASGFLTKPAKWEALLEQLQRLGMDWAVRLAAAEDSPAEMQARGRR